MTLENDKMREQMDNIAETDALLLSALHDGELRLRESEKLKRHLAAKGLTLENALGEFRQVGLQVQSWYEEEFSKQGELAADLNIWSAIEKKVRKVARAYENKAEASSWAAFWEALWRPQYGAVLASVVLLAVLLSSVVPRLWRPELASKEVKKEKFLASTQALSPAKGEELPAQSNLLQVNTRLDERQEGESSKDVYSREKDLLSVPPALAFRGEISDYFSDSSSDIFQMQPMKPAARIDWIQTKRKIQIVEGTDRRIPPVIWVARMGNDKLD